MIQLPQEPGSGHRPDPDPDDLMPARMINEFVYCPRLFYLEHVDGLFLHNQDTREGSSRHKRVDQRTDALAPGDEQDERELIHARSVTLSSDRYGVVAKLDLVEASGDMATPVDYKKGAPRKMEDGSLGAWDPERVQLCIQALVLRDNGYRCDEGILFFWKTRQRVRIPIDEALVAMTVKAIADARRTAQAGQIPPPLVDSPKCPRCSLVSICLPDETNRCRQLVAGAIDGPVQTLLFDVGLQVQPMDWEMDGDKIRQLVTPRDVRRPLYLNTQGYSVGVSGELLKVKEKGRVVQEVRMKDLNQVNLFGNVQVSTQAIQRLLQAEIPIVYFSKGGWFYGMTQPIGLKNILWRREQFRLADDSRFCLRLARDLVAGKIRNQRTLLMRNHVEAPRQALGFLKAMAWEAERAPGLGELLGLEGTAARTYFEHFSGMIKTPAAGNRVSSSDGEDGDTTPGGIEDLPAESLPDGAASRCRSPFQFDFKRRNRRPPRDPVNALLSLGYSLLAKDLAIAIAATGLDPLMGFYHQPRAGRPALALDLMEPFRPLIVDSAVLIAINQRMITPDDFVAAGSAVGLTPSGRKAFIRAYEQRMDQLVTHPLFSYRVSYRRLLEIQVRLLARVLLGEIRRYPTFMTR